MHNAQFFASKANKFERIMHNSQWTILFKFTISQFYDFTIDFQLSARPKGTLSSERTLKLTLNFKP